MQLLRTPMGLKVFDVKEVKFLRRSPVALLVVWLEVCFGSIRSKKQFPLFHCLKHVLVCILVGSLFKEKGGGV